MTMYISTMKAKGKSIMSSSTTKTKTTTVKPREKKVFSLPGQKFDVPEEVHDLLSFSLFALYNNQLQFSLFSLFSLWS